jgi:TrmH family RNA methyltransferase
MPYEISSTSNERIKGLIRLRVRHHRDTDKVFVVEGQRPYDRALRAGMTPEVTFVDTRDRVTAGLPVTVDPVVLDKASYRSRPEGPIADFPQITTRLDRVHVTGTPLVMIAEDIEKPGNPGAMLRTASAAGASAVITTGHAVDPHNPNVIRASTGALFDLPFAVPDWPAIVTWLDERGIELICATPDAATPLWDVDLTGPVAIVIGAEDGGVSDRARQLAARAIAIPQAHTSIDSLNVSVAVAVLLFEVVRQRSRADH